MLNCDEFLEDCLIKEIDYREVSRRLNKARELAFNYLRRSIDNGSTDLETGD
jgi:hypothetical protein